MKKSAFTLIELLVVITIIATLACVALPIYGKMIEKGRVSDDANHLRELGVATSSYLADHGGPIFSSDTKGGWPSVLYAKYLPNWKTFKSSFDGRRDGAAVSTGVGVPVSYGINVNILTRSPSGGSAFDGNTAKYTFPSQLIYMAPNVDLLQNSLTFLPGYGDKNVTLDAPANAPDNRGTHASRSQITVLFADYHVDSVGYRSFANPTGSNGDAHPRWQPVQNP